MEPLFHEISMELFTQRRFRITGSYLPREIILQFIILLSPTEFFHSPPAFCREKYFRLSHAKHISADLNGKRQLSLQRSHDFSTLVALSNKRQIQRQFL